MFSIPPHETQVTIPTEVNVIARRKSLPLFGNGLVEAIPDVVLIAREVLRMGTVMASAAGLTVFTTRHRTRSELGVLDGRPSRRRSWRSRQSVPR